MSMKHHDYNKASWRGKDLLGLHFRVTVYRWTKLGQELKTGHLEAGADAEVFEGCSLLVCSHDLLSLLSYRTQPGVGSTHNGLDHPSITN